MKKLLSFVLALMLALSCVFACAETDAYAADCTVNVNAEKVCDILTLLTGSSLPEEEVSLFNMIVDAINTVSVHAVANGLGLNTELCMNGQELICLYADIRDGLKLYTDLVPHLMFSVSQEEMAALMGTLPDLSRIDPQAYLAIIMEAFSTLPVSAEEVNAESNGVVYTQKTVLSFTGEWLSAFAGRLLAQAQQDLTALGLGDFAQNFSVAEEVGDLGSVTVYTNDEGAVYAVIGDEAAPAVTFVLNGNTAILESNGVVLNAVFTASETAVSAEITASVNGEPAPFSMVIGVEMAGSSPVLSCYINYQGMELAGTAAVTAGEEAVDVTEQLYFIDMTAPVVTTDTKLYATGESAGFNADETVQNVSILQVVTGQISTEELMNAAMSDLQNSALPVLLGKLQIAAPELFNTLMPLVMGSSN